MTINVTMSKEEFLDYNEYDALKQKVKCGIIDLNTEYSNLLNKLLNDGIWKDKNEYDKIIKKINSIISDLEEVNK